MPNEESEYSMNDYFIPLGGADEIGASSYFLSVDGINILLDCGARLKENELFLIMSEFSRKLITRKLILF